MLSHPRGVKSRNRFSRSIIRDVDKALPSTSSTEKYKSLSSIKQESNEKKDKPEITVKENESYKDSIKSSKADDKIITSKSNDDFSKKDDVSNMSSRNNRFSVKPNSDIMEIKDIKSKKDIKKEKIDFEHNENVEDKKVNKKVKNIFAKSIKKNEKKDKIPKVKTTETMPVAKKITKIKKQLTNLVKVMIPFKKTKNDALSSDQSDNQMKLDEDVPKLTRSKSKEDLPTKKKHSNACDSTANNSIVQQSSELIIENNSKVKKSVDANDKKKSIPKIKDKEIVNEITSTPTSLEELRLAEKNTGVTVGDNLIVHYGNNHDITYEAKVLNIMLNTDGDGYRFFVHYKGWNSRYDEWVDYKNVTLDVNNETEEVSKNEQKHIEQKKLPINKTKKSNIPTSSNQKKSLFSNTRPTRLCTLNNDQLSSIGKYTIKENSDSESEYSENVDLAKQDIKNTQQSLKTAKSEHAIIIKTEPLDMDSKKKSLYPKTYPSKEMILQRNVPRKPKSGGFKTQNNKSNEIEVSQQVTMKSPNDFNFETPNGKSINNEIIVKAVIPNKQVKISQNEPKISPIHYLSPKEKLKSYKLNDCKEKSKTVIESTTLPMKSKNSNVIFYSSSENEENLKITSKLTEESSLPLDNKSDKSKISGTDFDLNKIRSEMKGLIPHSVTSNTELFILDHQQAEIEVLNPIKPVTEDVYEFKESDTDFKTIPTVEEKHRRVIKHIDLPKSYNLEKTDSLSKGIKSAHNMEIVQQNESKLLFESNPTNSFDKDTKECVVSNLVKDFISHNQTITSNQYQNLIIDSKQVNEIANSQNTEEFDNNKVEVLNLCMKQPDSPQINIFNMQESSESNDVVDDEDDDDTKLVIVDEKVCSLTPVENEYNSSLKQIRDIPSTSQPSQIYLLPNKNSEFKTLNEPNTKNSPIELVDDSTISCKETVKNSPIQSFQMYSQFENQSTKLKDYQSCMNDLNTKTEVESELNKAPRIEIIKSVESPVNVSIDESTNNKEPINNFENKSNKDILNDENSIKTPEIQSGEPIFEDNNIISMNSKDIKYDCSVVKLGSRKDKLCDTRVNSNTNCSLEAKQSCSKTNDYDIYVPSTSKSILDSNISTKILDNNSVSNTNNCYENSTPSTSKRIFNSPETNLTNVLFCEETIPGSPSNEELEQYERRRAMISQALYEEHEAASAMYNMVRSYRKPKLTLMGATDDELEQYSNILQNNGVLDQRHLQFLAEISSRNIDLHINDQKMIVPPESIPEQITDKIEKRSEKSQKRKTSHESHPISKRNKISITNTSATEINIEKPSEIKMSIPLKDDKPLISFTPDMDTFQRQAAILAKINDLRKEYVVVKARISVVDRRRKKIKKRKRDLAKIAMIQNKQSTSGSK